MDPQIASLCTDLYPTLFSSPLYPGGDDALFRAWFCACHLLSLLSALANPILYGYYNEVSSPASRGRLL